MENPTNSISDKGDTKSLINECFAFCSMLTARDCKFSFTLRLGSSFTFSLASEQVTPTAKSRCPSYLRRQQRRRAAFLEKRAQNSPDKKTSASKQCSRQKEDNNRQINDDVDINCPLNLDPNPARHLRHSEGSVETDEPDEGLEEGLKEETTINEETEMTVEAGKPEGGPVGPGGPGGGPVGGPVEVQDQGLQPGGGPHSDLSEEDTVIRGHPVGNSRQGSQCELCQQIIEKKIWRHYPAQCKNCWTRSLALNSRFRVV